MIKKVYILALCFFIYNGMLVYSQIPQTNNLISYYPFLGNLEDQSDGNHDTGVINGNPSLTQNRFGTSNAAYYLDGTDDYLYFGNSIYTDLPDTDADGYYEDSYSISIWAKSSVVDNEIFIAFGEADGLYTGMISVIGTNIAFNSSNWGFPTTSTSGKKYDNNWHQYTFVYSAGSFRKLFIDGSLVKQANDSLRRFNFKNYGLSVGVGRFDAAGTPEGLTTTYTGSVDDVRIWNVALSNTEVSDLYTYENNAANDFSLPPDSTAPTGSLAYSVGGTTMSAVSVNDVVTITATFNESIADSPVMQISGSGVETISATNMTKVSANSYTYAWTVGTGDGTQTFALAIGTDTAGNVVTAAPTSGATITVDNIFSLEDLGTLVAWYDGNDPHGTGSVSAGDEIATWVDKSANNIHVTQATASKRPIVVAEGSKYAIQFDGNDMLSVDNAIIEQAFAEYTFISVVKSSVSGYKNIMGRNYSVWEYQWHGQSKINMYINSSEQDGVTGTYPFDGQARIGIFRYHDANNNLDQWIDGTSTSTTNYNQSIPSSTNNFYIGSRMGTAEFFNGEMLELIIFSEYLTDANRERVEDYLANKWGLNGPDLSPESGESFPETISPTASLAYSVGGTTVSAVSVNDVVTITATFNESIADSPVMQISGSGVETISATNMTKVSANSYTYAWTVGTGDGSQTFALATGTDTAGNVVTATPTSGVTITVDNTSPTVSSFVLSDSALKAGETATVTLTFSEAVTGFSSDADITVQNGTLSTMTTTDNITWTGTFTPSINIEDATNILTLSSNYTDVAGNAGPSATTSNYAIDTSLPTAAITYNSVSPYKNGETLVITTTFNEAMLDSPVSQIVITGSGIANVTATNMTKTSTTVYTYSYVVPTGDGIGTISLSNGTDLAGNAITSTPTSGTTFTVDNTVPTASLAYSVGATTVSSVSANDVVTITATFNESIADSPVMQISGSGVETISATNMTKVSANSYTYAWTVGTGDGSQTFALATGTDTAGNVVTAAPTSGATIVIDAPQHLTKHGKISIASADLVNKYGALGGSSGLTVSGKRISTSTASDGLTSATASTSAYQIKQDFPDSTDGLYWIANSNINSGTPFQIYADMTTDGGGWTLVLNYLHQGGTNPALAVKTNSFPIQASTTLGTDESAATTNWGHLAPATLNAMPFTQLRFYGKTSFHARIIHFKTTHANTIAYFKTGTGSMTGISSSYTALTGHTAYLPASTNSNFTNEVDIAMTNFPFYKSGNYHWGIRGQGSRWEVDNQGGNYNTFHQIWVK